MMRTFVSLMTIAAVCCCAVSANADTYTYGWEDGVGTILGSYGNVANPMNVTTPTHTGDHALQLTESPNGGTPQAYVAWVTGLQLDDVVEAGFWTYDPIDAEHPSTRIWGHYASDDIDEYKGSAGEGNSNTGYSNGIGWEEQSTDWIYGTNGTMYDGATSLVIEYRLYSPTGETPDFWCDDVWVTAPAHATVHFAPEPGSIALLVLGSLVLVRRR